MPYFRNKNAEEATQDIIKEQIPKLKELMDDKILDIENIDVFCENGVFDKEQSMQILKAGKDIGLRINFHGDELNPMESAEVNTLTSP